ncbi:hypothetical protein [Paracoccus sp. (in: a-proteobacteria)]|uniref:hypothetical protein n=1 Tax=Paracoccus sp. TaxID=267 RepID=UPI003A85CB24
MNISRILVAPLLVLLLVISAYSVMELANRVSAKRFVTSELVLARSSVTALVNNEGKTIAEASALPIKTEEKLLTRTLQRLEALEFTGADDTNATVYLLMKELFNLRKASSDEAVIRAANSDTQLTLANLGQEMSSLASGLAALQGVVGSGKVNDTQWAIKIRAASNQIPVIVEPKNPTETILRGIDLQFLSAIRELDTPQNAEVDYDSISSSVQDSIAQLKARQQAINELRKSVEQQLQKVRETIPSTPPSLQQRPGWAGPLFFLSTFPSDLILILAVVSAAGVGSLFAGLHRPGDDLFFRIVKGFIAGFVALLVIKGGTLLFTVDPELALDNSNPFSAAFLGVVAGLFTDRAFDALEGVVKTRLTTEQTPAEVTPDVQAPQPDAPKEPAIDPAASEAQEEPVGKRRFAQT